MKMILIILIGLGSLAFTAPKTVIRDKDGKVIAIKMPAGDGCNTVTCPVDSKGMVSSVCTQTLMGCLPRTHWTDYLNSRSELLK